METSQIAFAALTRSPSSSTATARGASRPSAEEDDSGFAGAYQASQDRQAGIAHPQGDDTSGASPQQDPAARADQASDTSDTRSRKGHGEPHQGPERKPTSDAITLDDQASDGAIKAFAPDATANDQDQVSSVVNGGVPAFEKPEPDPAGRLGTSQDAAHPASHHPRGTKGPGERPHSELKQGPGGIFATQDTHGQPGLLAAAGVPRGSGSSDGIQPAQMARSLHAEEQSQHDPMASAAKGAVKEQHEGQTLVGKPGPSTQAAHPSRQPAQEHETPGFAEEPFNDAEPRDGRGDWDTSTTITDKRPAAAKGDVQTGNVADAAKKDGQSAGALPRQPVDAAAFSAAEPYAQEPSDGVDTPRASPPPAAAVSVPGVEFAAHATTVSTEGAVETMIADPSAPESLRSDRTLVQASPAVPLNRPDIAQSVATQIADVFRSSGDGKIEVTLRPEELGRLSLTFSNDARAMHVTLAADRPETLDLLRRNIDVLERELRDLGFDSLNFDFGHAPDQDQEHARDAKEREMGAIQQASEDQPRVLPSNAPVRPAQTPSGGVDLRL